ncbi:hypothetical protein, partial [Staphylococcus aureus]|uniref:hypothetical protein n=1 Tax=Staphylococcus aureus TaxID=1280 RepID=UPI001C8345F9
MSLLRLDRLHYCILMSMGCISSPLVWAEDLNSDVEAAITQPEVVLTPRIGIDYAEEAKDWPERYCW